MKSCILLGSKSDIAKAILPMLEKEYQVYPWSREDDKNNPPKYYGDRGLPMHNWDLLMITIGRVAPVGLFADVDFDEFDTCVRSNLLLPALLLRHLLPLRNRGATVIWFAGSNPQTIMPGYSAYNTSKMAVLKLVEQLDAETPDCKFIALGPGVCSTKIHSATILQNWPNPRLTRALKDGSFTKMEDVYKTIQWCIAQSKEVVGGRNICVSDMDYRHGNLAFNLTNDESMFKLRRNEGRKTI